MSNGFINGTGNLTFQTTSINNLISSNLGNLTFSANCNVKGSNFSNVTNLTVSGGSIFSDTVFSSTGNLSLSNSTFRNVTFNLDGANTVSFINCIVEDCTIIFTSASSTVSSNGANSILKNSSFIFSTPNCVLNLSGTVIGNKFDYRFNTVVSLTGTFNILDNRFFIGASGNINSQFLIVADGSRGLISQNHFIRDSNILISYILGPISWTNGIVSIINNYFDSDTYDGINQNLIKYLPSAWIYQNSKNNSVNVYRTSPGSSYIVKAEDNVLAFNLTAPITITLPIIANSIPGRTVTIKDANGKADLYPITIHSASTTTDAIENVYGDYIYKNPYGSITLVASIDPNGGSSGSGLTPKYMWIII